MKRIVLKIGGMSCTACSSSLERFLNKQAGIASASVNLLLNTADVEFDDSVLKLSDVEDFISKIGFESLGEFRGNELFNNTNLQSKSLVILGVCAVSLLLLAMVIAPSCCSFLQCLLCSVVQFVLAIMSAFIAFPLLKRGFLALSHMVPTMESLVSIGWCAAFFYSFFLLLRFIYGHLPSPILYFDSSVMVLFFVHLGYFIENYHKNKTVNVIYSLAMMTPETASRLSPDGKETIVGIADVKPGDILVCKPSQRIAADGVVIEGSSYVDESFISGESLPIFKEQGCKVIAGAQNINGSFSYKVKQVGRDSSISSIVRMVTQAAGSRSSIQRLADRASLIFVWIVLGVALLAFFFGLFITNVGLQDAVVAFVNVLVVACPCALGISAPLAIVAATNKAASFGVMIKNAAKLEVLPKVDVAFLDKTGSLTEGKMFVTKSIYFNGFSSNDVLPLVASAENESQHPIGMALVKLAFENKISLMSVSSLSNEPGLGFSAVVNGQSLIVGSLDWLKRNSIDCKQYILSESSADSLVFCAINRTFCAVYGINDSIKSSAKSFVTALKGFHICPTLLSGDGAEAANSVATSVGISNVLSQTLPVDKARYVEAARSEGHTVLMFGDGINDAPALIRADVGLSLSSGTEIAANSADFVLMSENLNNVILLLQLAKKTCSVIWQNLFWAFSYNICMLPIAAGFFVNYGLALSPNWSAFAMVISCLFVIANSCRIRFMRFK